jgi:hypothetical protein
LAKITASLLAKMPAAVARVVLILGVMVNQGILKREV